MICPKCNKEDTEYWIKEYKMCFECHNKKETEEECKRAVIEGQASSKNRIICPYCGDYTDEEIWAYKNQEEMECWKCGKVFHIAMEYTIEVETKVIE